MREESVAGILDFSLYGFLAADSSFRRASIRNDNTHYFTRSKIALGLEIALDSNETSGERRKKQRYE